MPTVPAPIAFDPSPIRTVLCDLDGVVWLDHRPIPGAVEAIASLRAGGRRVLFVTNNSAARVSDHEAALAAIGVTAVGDVVSSAMAAARLVASGERVLVTGGPGIVEAIELRGAIAVLNDGTVTAEPFDAVVVGLDRTFDYPRLRAAATALHDGARLVGTNTDSTYPTPSGLDPGGGAILAAIATAGETTPEVAGKPNAPMAALLAATLSTTTGFDPTSVVMVGDRPETDGLMAARLGSPFALVRSGVTAPGDIAPDIPTAIDVADLAALAGVLGAR
ncbi:MAG: HAD-IIA family hydrolase [Ilumatobacter sp.]|nr:HAD-IIA family hydrolase [Ilumatobacter sp.]